MVVDMDIGRTTMPLSEIERWVPGVLVGLSPPELKAGIEVTLRINSRAIAVGDLVLIDNRLAVRITRMLATD